MSSKPYVVYGRDSATASGHYDDLRQALQTAKEMPGSRIVAQVSIKQVVCDGSTQCRLNNDPQTIEDYAESYREGKPLPAVILFSQDGETYWIGDGYHRVEGRQLAGMVDIEAEIKLGGKREALRYSLGANDDHGLKLSRGDKRNKVKLALEDLEWLGWADNSIARLCRVSNHLVAQVRQEMGAHLGNLQDSEKDESAVRTVQRGGQTYQIDTAKIGSSNKRKEEPARGDAYELPVVKPATTIPVHHFDRAPAVIHPPVAAAPVAAAPVNVVSIPEPLVPGSPTKPEGNVGAAPKTWDMEAEQKEIKAYLATKLQACPGEHQTAYRAALRDFLASITPSVPQSSSDVPTSDSEVSPANTPELALSIEDMADESDDDYQEEDPEDDGAPVKSVISTSHPFDTEESVTPAARSDEELYAMIRGGYRTLPQKEQFRAIEALWLELEPRVHLQDRLYDEVMSTWGGKSTPPLDEMMSPTGPPYQISEGVLEARKKRLAALQDENTSTIEDDEYPSTLREAIQSVERAQEQKTAARIINLEQSISHIKQKKPAVIHPF